MNEKTILNTMIKEPRTLVQARVKNAVRDHVDKKAKEWSRKNSVKISRAKAVEIILTNHHIKDQISKKQEAR